MIVVLTHICEALGVLPWMHWGLKSSVGHYLDFWSAAVGLTLGYSFNVWTAAKCSGTDKQIATAMSQFVNPGAHDWHLKAEAAAIDAGDPNDYPATDRDGLARAGAPDAGAHEYNGGSPSGGDSDAPTPPAGVVATGGSERVSLDWQAASDDVGVARYDVIGRRCRGSVRRRRIGWGSRRGRALWIPAWRRGGTTTGWRRRTLLGM